MPEAGGQAPRGVGCERSLTASLTRAWHGGPARLRPVARFLLPFPALLIVLGCGSDATPSPPQAPELSFLEIRAPGGDAWTQDDGNSTELDVGCAPAVLSLEFGPKGPTDELGAWQLRPEGACDGDDGCGFLVLSVERDNIQQDYATARRFLELDDPTLLIPGELRLRLRLFSDAGQEVLEKDAEGELVPVATEVELSLVAHEGCPEDGAAGAASE